MSSIEWTEQTWNPTSGCDRISPGCDNCYALTMAKRLKGMGQAKYQNDGDPRTSGPGFALTVEYRGRDRWAVKRHSQVLGSDGTWDYEMRTSEREDEWLATHRFDLDTALKLAKEQAPLITVNGHTVADALAMRQASKEERP